MFTSESWDFLDSSLSPTQLTEAYENFTTEIVNAHCPKKTVYFRPDDSPFLTEALKTLKRRIMREYERKGKSEKYFQLKLTFDEKMSREREKYKEKVMKSVADGNLSSTYKALRKLGSRPGESSTETFLLPCHEALSPAQAAEAIADHFAAISNEYDPINQEKLALRVQQTLHDVNFTVPSLEEFEVYHELQKAKKPLSTVPGDIPQKILREFTCELTKPITIIFNSILQSLTYPKQWITEYQIPIPKVHPPTKMDDLRNIAKTSFISKVFESFLADWLLPIVKPYLAPCQYGMKGASTSHYLIKLLQFIHDHLDLKEPHAVVLAQVDLSKAFNRVSHSMVIEDLHDMKVPPWLLKILISYLSGRSMILSYQGASSTRKPLPGSTPQGAFLGIFLFIIKINGASLRPTIPRILPPCSSSQINCTA